MPIKSFAHKGLENFYNTGTKKGIQPHHAKKLDHILQMLDDATKPGDMDLPGFEFHLLEPKENAIYAVKVNGNYRITFYFPADGSPESINYLDYH